MSAHTESPPLDALQREQLRQQALLCSLWGEGEGKGAGKAGGLGPEALQNWLAPVARRPGTDPQAQTARGWQAYAANGHAIAERALAAAFPTVRQLMGDDSFAAMARAHWHANPPRRGDLAWLGQGLPDFIEASDQLAAEPYLADSARLDWALHACESAPDAQSDLASLHLLAEHDPAALRLHLVPGAVVLKSSHPIVSIWQAHHQPVDATDPFATVRQAFAAGQGECALVWRQGWRARVQALEPGDAMFISALLVDGADTEGVQAAAPGASPGSPAPLGAAMQTMQQARPDWDFQPWLLAAVQGGWLSHLSPVD